MRGAFAEHVADGSTDNLIWPTGEINGLNLKDGEILVIRDFTIPVNINTAMNMAPGSTLELVLEDGEWGSIVHVDADIVPDLDGSLGLSFSPDADFASLLGAELQLFQWNGVLQAGQQFTEVVTSGPLLWNLDRLYTEGVVTLSGLSGDANLDGVVGLSDFNLLKNAFGKDMATFTDGDFNGDAMVNLADFNILKQHFGASVVSETVPEPSGLAMLISLFLVSVARIPAQYLAGRYATSR